MPIVSTRSASSFQKLVPLTIPIQVDLQSMGEKFLPFVKKK